MIVRLQILKVLELTVPFRQAKTLQVSRLKDAQPELTWRVVQRTPDGGAVLELNLQAVRVMYLWPEVVGFRV